MNRVPENYRSLVTAYNREDETTPETLNRLIHAPNPDALAEMLTVTEVEEAREAAQRFDRRDAERWKRAREAFE